MALPLTDEDERRRRGLLSLTQGMGLVAPPQDPTDLELAQAVNAGTYVPPSPQEEALEAAKRAQAAGYGEATPIADVSGFAPNAGDVVPDEVPPQPVAPAPVARGGSRLGQLAGEVGDYRGQMQAAGDLKTTAKVVEGQLAAKEIIEKGDVDSAIIEAAQKRKEAELLAQQDEERVLASLGKQERDAENLQQESINEAKEKHEAAMKDPSGFYTDPDGSVNWVTVIGAAIAAGMGSLSSAMLGQPNHIPAMLNSAVKRSYQAKKDRIAAAKEGVIAAENELLDIEKKFGNKRAAAHEYASRWLNRAATNFDIQVAKLKAPAAKESAKNAAGIARAKSAEEAANARVELVKGQADLAAGEARIESNRADIAQRWAATNAAISQQKQGKKGAKLGDVRSKELAMSQASINIMTKLKAKFDKLGPEAFFTQYAPWATDATEYKDTMKQALIAEVRRISGAQVSDKEAERMASTFPKATTWKSRGQKILDTRLRNAQEERDALIKVYGRQGYDVAPFVELMNESAVRNRPQEEVDQDLGFSSE